LVGLLVALVSVVLVAVVALLALITRLLRADGARLARSTPAATVPSTPAATVPATATATVAAAPAEATRDEPTHRAEATPGEVTGLDIALVGTSAAAITAGTPTPAPAVGHLAARDADEIAHARARAEREIAERLARAERNAAELRRHAESEAAAIRDGAEADVALLTARAEASAREEARAQAQARADEERRRADAARDRAEAELTARRAELRERDGRLAQREARVEDRAAGVEDHARRLEARDRELAERDAALVRRAVEADELVERRVAALERTATLTSAQARTELLKVVETQARLDAAALVRDVEARAQDEADERARRIITLAIQRLASEQTAESVVSVLHLPGDEMKGRIIGREGRNIRAFEAVTGVNVVIDDTPEAVLLSCFDPVRREIGRLTLAALVSDGRIHPHRIEEEHERARREVEARCVRAGEDAVVEIGITDMHPELIVLLGRLRYRTSYGQNVLGHLVECAHLAGIMAAELRLPTVVAKRGTLLHDLGKALTHEVEGSHALIGAEIARRYGEHDDVVHAIEAHHNEVEPRSVAAVLTQAADAISGGRPGARRDSLESYVRRLERIERIAGDRPGVEKVFAMQAGREVRVMVIPEEVDDAAAHLLARDVARQIEDELTYPGQIRVTVVRETRAIGTAR
jgi:ribonuclease Y